MHRALYLCLAIFLLACSATVDRPIAAIEVPTATQADRTDLLELIRQVSLPEEFHVDDGSSDFRRGESRKTFYAGVWNGTNDEDFIALVDDGEHQGRTWITGYPGKVPKLAERFWKVLRSGIIRRWPNAKMIPILSSGGLPLASDLKLTSAGYKIVESASVKYELPSASPLIANDR